MSLANLIVGGMQAGAGSFGRALDDAFAVSAYQQQQRERERRLAQEVAARTFLRGQLLSRLAQADPTVPRPGDSVMGPPAGPRPAPAGAAPPPIPSFGGLNLDDPDLPVGVMQDALDSFDRLSHQRAELDHRRAMAAQKQLRDQQVQQTFERSVNAFADMLRNDGFEEEADRFRMEARATRKWPSWATKPLGVVEPATIEALSSEDPAVQAQGIADFMAQTGGKMPSPSLLRTRPEEVTPEVMAGLMDPDPQRRAAAAADYQNRTNRPPPSSLLYRPEKGAEKVSRAEADARLKRLYDAYGGEANIDPVMREVFRDRVLRGERISTEEFQSATIDDKYADRGEEEALKIDAEDAAMRLKAVEREYAEALKKAKDNPDRVDPNIVNRREVARLQYAAARAAIKDRLRGRGQRRPRPPSASPGAPAARTSPAAGAPAAPPALDEALMDQIDAEMPGATPEEKAAEYRRRSQR